LIKQWLILIKQKVLVFLKFSVFTSENSKLERCLDPLQRSIITSFTLVCTQKAGSPETSNTHCSNWINK